MGASGILEPDRPNKASATAAVYASEQQPRTLTAATQRHSTARIRYRSRKYKRRRPGGGDSLQHLLKLGCLAGQSCTASEGEGRAGPRAEGGKGPRARRGAPPGENAPSRPAASWSPTGWTRSTIGARGLNFRVRDGTGCASPAMAAGRLGAFCLRGAAFHRALGAAQRAQASSPPGPPMGRACGGARPISAARLRRSPALHLRPIELVVYEWPYRREISSRDGLPA